MKEPDFVPFPELSGERILLRRLTEEDAEDVYAFRSDPETMRFIPRPVAKSREDALAVIRMISDGIEKKQSINWAIRLKESRRVIGIVGYVKFNLTNSRAEIGYVLHKDFRKQGYASEALHAALRFGFRELRLNCVEALVHKGNTSSCTLLEKAGFVKEGTLRDFNFMNDLYGDVHIYSLLNREYAQNTL